MGDAMSPTISIVPFMLPIKLEAWPPAGTSFATGLPRLVIKASVLDLCTSSSRSKHLALNSPAAIFFMVTMVTIS